MIIGIKDVYYNVSNMKTSIDFYTKVLGMNVQFETDYWTSLELDNLTIGLHWTEGSPVPDVSHDSHGAHSGATLTLRSDNISSDKQMLVDNSVNIIGELDEEFGEIVVFQDPDGNVLKLMDPKY
jgi:catechol 2,3-dioxygenase-like lactoylglutathione lyase family enzyme